MTTSRLTEPAEVAAAISEARLAVTWQHPDTRRMHPVGLLTCDAAGYRFEYLARATDLPDFRPFLGFPEFHRRYESTSLFPLFSQRILRRSRPDFAAQMAVLALDGDVTDWQVLGRSQGLRHGDGIRVFAEPTVHPDGRITSTFFVNGLRHLLARDPHVSVALGRMRGGGDALSLRAEPANPVDSQALLVVEADGVPLGYVPRVLVPTLAHVQARMPFEVTTVEAHGPDVVPAFRLLVRWEGQADIGFVPFSGPDWRVMSDHTAVPTG